MLSQNLLKMASRTLAGGVEQEEKVAGRESPSKASCPTAQALYIFFKSSAVQISVLWVFTTSSPCTVQRRKPLTCLITPNPADESSGQIWDGRIIRQDQNYGLNQPRRLQQTDIGENLLS